HRLLLVCKKATKKDLFHVLWSSWPLFAECQQSVAILHPDRPNLDQPRLCPASEAFPQVASNDFRCGLLLPFRPPSAHGSSRKCPVSLGGKKATDNGGYRDQSGRQTASGA